MPDGVVMMALAIKGNPKLSYPRVVGHNAGGNATGCYACYLKLLIMTPINHEFAKVINCEFRAIVKNEVV